MAVLDYVNGTLESARRQADRVVAPDSRQKAYDATLAFAQERPILFSFLVAQGLFSLLPLLLFASFAFGTVALATISALLFSLFWIGVAALVLGGTLLVTSGLALLAWVWVVGAYLAASFVHGLVFSAGGGGRGHPAGGSRKSEEEQQQQQQQRLMSEKWARLVQAEPGLGVNGVKAVEEEEKKTKENRRDDAGEKDGAQGGL